MGTRKIRGMSKMGEKSPLQKKPNKYITSLPLLLLALPALLWLLVFHYLPIFGVVVAFQNFNYRDKFASPFVGFENFEYFFKSSDAFRVIRNTIGYHILFQLVSMLLGIIIALLMYEINSKGALKFFQTTMAMPSNISWVIMAYIVYAFLNYKSGILNSVITNLGGEAIAWYNEPKYWPFILTVTSCWKGVGVGSILYYATLTGIDSGLYEAAALDGANRLQQTRYVSIPHLLPIISIMLITGVAGALGGDQGLFYQVPKDSSMLYPTTDVLSTYVQRGVLDGNFAITAAVGLFQNIVGLILLLTTNGIIKKISPENSML